MNDRIQTVVAAAIVTAIVMSVATVPAAEVPDYRRDIKPLLEAKCFVCHSALKQEAELRLDAISLIRQGGESGAVIIPRNAADSLLMRRVRSTDIDLRMPPADTGHPLTDKQIALLKSWIDSGAAGAG